MKTIGVLFGGVSSEHAVSCLSAASIIPNIPKNKYELVLVGITRDGRWLRYFGDMDTLANDTWDQDPSCVPCILSPDRATHGFVQINSDGTVETIYVDAVFPVLHGKNGEDGTMQGLFMLAGIPFVGCDLLASAVCMDKTVTDMLLDYHGIRRAEWRFITKADKDNVEVFADECEKVLGYPMFIKPANAGSSIGVSKARNREEFFKAVDEAFRHDAKVIAEREIVGQEIECAVLGNDAPTASVLGEIASGAEFYDYDDKYINDVSELFIPARIAEDKSDEIRKIAVEAYKALGCTGLARVDFLLEKATGIAYLNELNTLPGFTSISMYPKLFDACGVVYPDLLTRLIELSFERTEEI